MFAWWSPLVVKLRWVVLAAAVVVFGIGATWGTGVFGVLTGGGFTDPDSESVIAQERIVEEVGRQDSHLAVIYSSPTATVDDPELAGPVTQRVAALRASPLVAEVQSWYDTGSPALVSEDRHATLVTIQLAAAEDEDALLAGFREVRPLLAAPGVTTQIGGLVAFYDQAVEQTERDIVRAEAFSFPILLVLLVLIFRGVVAAVTPLLIGGLAILGGFMTTRLLAGVTDMSIFAINIITVIGLGLAIDYSLLVVNRFREELGAGQAPASAVGRTLATAGRAVLVSGLTTIFALASLLIFPQAYLRSMALGGIAAIAVAMLGTLTVLPALLAVLGHRINAGRVPLPRWRRRPAPAGTPEGGWARVARSVMRRPVPYLVGTVAILLLLASPAPRAEFGGFDERELPAGAEPRVVAERIRVDFPQVQPDPVVALVSGATPEQAAAFADQLTALPAVTGAAVTAQRGDSSVITVSYPGEPTSDAAAEAVRQVRDAEPPAGAEVLVTGRTASEVDLLASLRAGLPWMLMLMGLAVMLVLFFAFGSVVLPIKAVLMNLFSIAAALGVVVWGFQDGHLSGLLDFTPTGFMDPTVLLLTAAILFGISTDYEVFLLSRVREEWDRTGDNTSSVAYGLQRTGRIITAAALLLIVVIGGFTTGEMAFVKLLGIGVIVAIALDATLIRTVLVPATMRVLGRWNWWAPGPIARLHRRIGIKENEDLRAAPAGGDR